MIQRYKHSSLRRKARIRAKAKKSLEGVRLSVFRSNKYMYSQVVDLKTGKTLGGVRGQDPQEIGKRTAEMVKKMKLAKVVFDRGAYRYHGNVKKLAEATREGGLKI